MVYIVIIFFILIQIIEFYNSHILRAYKKYVPDMKKKNSEFILIRLHRKEACAFVRKKKTMEKIKFRVKKSNTRIHIV